MSGIDFYTKKLLNGANLISKEKRFCDLFFDYINRELKYFLENNTFKCNFDFFIFSKDTCDEEYFISILKDYIQNDKSIIVLTLDYIPRVNFLCKLYNNVDYVCFSYIEGNLFEYIRNIQKNDAQNTDYEIKINKAEYNIMLMYISGYSLEEIAHKIGYSKHTTKKYLSRIYEKLGIQNNRQLIQFALNLGIIDDLFYKDGCNSQMVCKKCDYNRCLKTRRIN